MTCDAGFFGEVGEAGDAPPCGGRARRRVGSAVGLASEPCDRPDMDIKIARCPALSVPGCVLEQMAFGLREVRGRVRARRLAAGHRQPGHPPGHGAARRDAVGQMIGLGRARLLDPASGFRGPEDCLDLPAQRLPFELVHGVRVGRDGQVRDRLPDDGARASGGSSFAAWMIWRSCCRHVLCFPIGGRTLIEACRTANTARWSFACASRNRTSWVPLDCAPAIALAIGVPPSSARRSTQLGTRKPVPRSSARQESAQMSLSRSPTCCAPAPLSTRWAAAECRAGACFPSPRSASGSD